MDEWGFAFEKSRLIECYMIASGNERVDAANVPEKGSTLRAKSAGRLVPPNGTVDFMIKVSEIKRSNDEISFQFSTPTMNPQIHVQASASLAFLPTFGPSDEDAKVKASSYGDRYEFAGTYFPGQRMRLRWWPKDFSTSS